jgi:dGTPase
VRNGAQAVIAFSSEMAKSDKDIKGFLYPRMYRHDWVMRVMGDAERVVRDLFSHYVATPADLPNEWADGISGLNEAARARRIGDYIAGMTDRYALVDHANYFKSTPDLR